MRLLLDTHVVLALLRGTLAKDHPEIARTLAEPMTAGFVSVASLWEMAIKSRLGKLDLGMPLEDIVGCIEAVGIAILSIKAPHVIVATHPEPEIRDPFDRLLLAQCQVENFRLATVDRMLFDHPLALAI